MQETKGRKMVKKTVATPWQWQFPPCRKYIPISNPEREEQCGKIGEESFEVFAAFRQRDLFGIEPYIMELMDEIHACETALREFPPAILDEVKRRVVEKNENRRYYE